LYPSVHGSSINGVRLPDYFATYPELLRQAGYETLASGKMHLNPISRFYDKTNCALSRDEEKKYVQTCNGKKITEPGEIPDDFPYYGFEKVEFIEGYKSNYLKFIQEHHPELWESANHHVVQEHPDAPLQTNASPISEEVHRSTWTADKAIDMLKNRNSDKPFLLHCSFFDPHHPFDPPAQYRDMYNPDDMPLPIPAEESDFDALPSHFRTYYEKDNSSDKGNWKSFKKHSASDWQQVIAHYYGMISLLDKQIGKVISYLKEDGLYDDTVIFFISDHGELLGDHGIALKGPYHYQGLIRVPFIMSYPKLFAPGVVDDEILSYDLMPTILDLAGISKPKVTAKSIIPLITEQTKIHDGVLVEGNGLRTVVYKGYRLSIYSGTDEGELFDLKNDPQEKHNLWNTDIKLQAGLLQKLNQLQIEAIRPLADPIGVW